MSQWNKVDRVGTGPRCPPPLWRHTWMCMHTFTYTTHSLTRHIYTDLKVKGRSVGEGNGLRKSGQEIRERKGITGSWQDGLAGQDTCCQARKPESTPWNPHSEEERSWKLSSDLYIGAVTYSNPPTHAHAPLHKINKYKAKEKEEDQGSFPSCH